MWQILRSEIEYNKYVLIAVYVFALFFFLVGLVEDDVYSVVPNTMVPFFIGFGFLCHTSCKESRVRQHCMLPQSRTEYGITRMLFFALFQGGIFVLWLITYVVNIGESPEAIWMMLSANALVLTIRAVGFVFEDTKSRVPCITSAEGWTPSSIAQRMMRFVTYWALGIMLIVVAAGPADGFTLIDLDVDWAPIVEFRTFLRAPMGAFTMNVMFMIAFYLSATFSLPRRSFASSR